AYNYLADNVAERIMRDTNGRGVDIALNTVGGATIQSTMDSMADDGKVLSFGSTGGRLACFDLGIGARNIQLLSFSISTSARFLPETMRTFREVAIPLFANGAFKAVVDRVLPLDRVHDAHRMIDERAHYGKIILAVD
ncbi:MAG: zinc-binding dehydrogenase, partial [Dehalococcoidia bacterium]|nr:zinc-binding dehydrogenase [Dehalococcoidia bacterium]